MDALAELLATHELQKMLMNYWHDVDTNWGRNASDYYTEDAVFEASRNTYRGRAKIKQFYQWRLDQGPRTAVHGVSNFRVEFESDRRALSSWYLLLYARDGKPPLPTNPPIQIALMTDVVVRGDDGRWRYEYRKFGTLFEGGVPTTNPNLDEAK